MNKLCYRLVFNKVRGQLMAVQETARSNGGGAAAGGSGAAATAAGLMQTSLGCVRLKCLPLLLAQTFGITLLCLSATQAQVVADHNAPGTQQATVLSTANGVIQVNIQTPSAAGVSRNAYTQFDVPQGGVVLNNSRTNVQSQLGGWVQGNPWLATGSARVILNEVRSSDPSQLRGYIEVAGTRAEMVLANPAGINVDGGGFINISRATLTTGTPVLSNGGLDGYRVQRGAITVTGAGLDASGVNYTDLIARSVALNAGVWAQQLAVTTGANQVNHDNTSVAASTGSGAVPLYGIDVSQLGGMYANKITLVGTEAGVGVRSAGTIGAAAGEVVVTTEGRLENSGSIAATAALRLQAQAGMDNSGKLYSDVGVTASSGADLVNSGIIYATDALTLTAATALSNSGTLSGQGALQVTATRMANSGIINSEAAVVLAIHDAAGNVGGTIQAKRIDFTSATGGIDNSGGQIVQGGSAALDVSAVALFNGAGGVLGASAPTSTAGGASGETMGGGTADAASGTATGTDTVAGSAGAGTGATAPATVAVPAGVLHAATTFNNNGGQVTAGGAIGVTAASLDNSGGAMNVKQLAVSGADFSNRHGTINVQTNLTASSASVDNRGGEMLVGATFDGQLGSVNNTDGLLQASQLHLAVAGDLDNTRGVLRQTGLCAAPWSVGGQLNNTLGAIETAGDLVLATGSLTGSGGALTVLGKLRLDSGTASAVNGNWIINGSADVHSGAFDNGGGSILAGAGFTASTAAFNNMAGTVATGGALMLSAGGGLDNRGGLLQAGTDLDFSVAGVLANDGGVIETQGTASAMRLQAGAIDNASGHITNAGAGDAVIGSEAGISSAGLMTANGNLAIHAQTLTNRDGARIVAGAGLTIAGGAVDNDGGSIATVSGSGADVALGGSSMSNKGGTVLADRDLALTLGGALDNGGGAIQAARQMVLVAGGFIDNTAGKVETIGAASTLSLHAASLTNVAGSIVNAGSGGTAVSSAGDINNSGLIAGNGDVTLAAQTTTNLAAGAIAAGGNLMLAAAQQFNNLGGAISANGTVQFEQRDANLINSGQIAAGGGLHIAAATINNDGGQLATIAGLGADVQLTAASLSNRGGAVYAARDIGVAVDGAIVNDAGTVQAGRNLLLSGAAELSNNSGVIEALGTDSALDVRAGAIANSGRIVNVGTGGTAVASVGALANSGTIAGNGALTVQAHTVENLGALSAMTRLDLAVTGTLNNSGTVNSGATLTFVQPTAMFVNSGQVVAGGQANISAASVVNDGGQIATASGSGADILLNSENFSNLHGAVLADRDVVMAVAGALDNTGGTLHAANLLALSAGGALTNSGGVIEAVGAVSQLDLRAASINSLYGRIVNVGSGDALVASQGSISNSGLIAGNGNLTLRAQTLDNAAAGQVNAGGALELGVSQQLDNVGGISSGGTLNFSQAGANFNNAGRVVAGGTASIVAARINNDGGQLATTASSAAPGADIVLAATMLTNHGGTVLSARDLTLALAGNADNQGGTMQASRDLALGAGGALNNDGGVLESIGAASGLTLQAAAIDNAAGRIVNVGSGSAVIVVQGEVVNGGTIAANGGLDISAATLDNKSEGTLSALQGLSLRMTQQMYNAGAISSGVALDLALSGAHLVNSGQIVAGAGATIDAADVVNDGGQIATAAGSGADIALSATTLSNRAGTILADGALGLTTSGALDNTTGNLQAAAHMQLDVGGALANGAGVIQATGAASTLNLQAAVIDNGAGRIINVGTGAARINADGGLSNSGVIGVNGSLALGAATADNLASGTISSGGALALAVTQQLRNLGTINSGAGLTFEQDQARFVNRGQVLTGGAATLAVAQLDNDTGQIATLQGSGAGITLHSGATSNVGGSILADGALALTVDGAMDNSRGAVQAATNLQLTVGGALTNNGGSIEARDAGSTFALQAGAIANLAGRIVNVGTGDTSVGSEGAIVNSGTIAGNGGLALAAATLENQVGGAIVAGRQMDLAVSRQLDNHGGTISSGGALEFDQAAAGFSNSGQVVSGGAVTLRAASFNNDGGQLATVVGSGADVVLNAQSVSNQGGSIMADHDVSVTAGAALNNNHGTVQAGKDLTLYAAGALSNDAGVIEASASDSLLQVQAGSVSSLAGRIVNVGTGATRVGSAGGFVNSGTVAGNGDLVLAAATLANLGGGTIQAGLQLDLAVTTQLDNHGGTISSGGGLNFDQTGANFINSGAIVSGGDISVHAAGIDNDGGQLATVASSGAGVTLSGQSLSNLGGSISADGDANVVVSGVLENDGGTLQAGKSLELSVGGALNNGAGVIEAVGAASTFQLLAGGINNGVGRIVNVGTGATSITSLAGITNGGTIAGNGSLALSAQTLTNQDGASVLAGQRLVLGITGQFDNHGGNVSSGGALQFEQAGASFRNSGQIVSGGAATIRAASFNNDGGQLATRAGAGADLLIASQSISNQAGTIMTGDDATLTSGGALNNNGGIVQAGHDLQLTAGGTLSNSAGVIEAIAADSTLELQAGNVDNAAGRVVNVGTGATRIRAQAGIVNSGQMAGNGVLTVGAATFQNQAGGQLVSGQGLELGITQELVNQGSISSAGSLTFHQAGANFTNSGQVVAGAGLDIIAASIDNDAGQIATASGSGADVTLTAQSLSNRGGGVFAAHNATLAVSGGVDNTLGTLQAAMNLAVSAGGALNNTGGVIEAINAGSTLGVHAASIDNAAGRIVNVGSGDTTIAAGGGIVNGGLMAGNGTLSLLAQTLQNNAGASIVAGLGLALGVTQQLNNAGGTISSGGTLTFNQAGASFSNSGQIVAGGQVALTADQFNNDGGQISTVANSGAGVDISAQGISNRAGSVVADGDGTFSAAGVVDNTGGTLRAGVNLQLGAGGALNNGGGIVEAAGAGSTLLVQALALDNSAGTIVNAGLGGSTVGVQGSLYNSGRIATNGDLTLQAQTLQNAAGGIIESAASLDLQVAQQLANQGSITSAGTLTFNQPDASLYNSGQLLSGGAMTLNANVINDDGGQIGTAEGGVAALAITSQVLSNLGGQIKSDGDLTIGVLELQAQGDMAAGRDLSLALAGDYTQTGSSQLHANRDLSLSVGGTLTNTATLEAVRNLALSAGQIDNQAGAVMQGEGVAITASGALTNAGDINGTGVVSVTAASVDNHNAIVGGDLVVRAQTVNNAGSVALLGATNSMALWVGDTLNNTGSGTIYSAGAIAIAADATRDGNGDLSHYTATVNNLSSTIEAAGNLELTASTVNNIRENIVIDKVQTIDETTTMTMPDWWTLNPGDAGGNHHEFVTSSSNYHAYEVYFVDPSDILEQSTVVTPDGNQVTRVVIRTHANDSVFYSASAGYAGNYGKRARIDAADGTKVLYSIQRLDGQVNPDQGGGLDGASYNDASVNNWDASTLSLSSQYGTCSTNCVRLVSYLDYTDPANTIQRDSEFVIPGAHDTDGYELQRIAHHTAVDDVLSASSGAVAQILAGGDMRIVLGQTLNNTYGAIMAGGTYVSTGGDTNNTGMTLYRTHSFDGVREYSNAASTNYTAGNISEVIGQVGGVISGAGGVYISGRSFNNVDVSAGTVGNVLSDFTVLSGSSAGAGTSGSAGGSGTANHAATGNGAGASGAGNQAGTSGAVGPMGAGGTLAGNGGIGGSGAGNNAIVYGAVDGVGVANNASGTANVSGTGGNHTSTGGGADASGVVNNASGSGLAGGGAGNTSYTGTEAIGSGGSDSASLRGKAGVQALTGVKLNGATINTGDGAGQNAAGLQAASGAGQGGSASVVNVAPTGLASQNPDAGGSYLFETRSQFANLRDWASSDYLLQALQLDPNTTQKRLGDGFYEQNLVREQLQELTGRTVAVGAASDAAYQAMLTSAVSYAEEWNLRPGIALTAEQVSRLTSDIVWLESQTVSLPDGSRQTVLVPKVYLAHVAGGSVKASGALVTGDSVTIVVDDLVNRGGTIDGSNASGTGRTVLVATNDLVNQGGTIAGNDVVLQAGRDLVNQTLTATQSYTTADNSGSYTALANHATISATGTLTATAGRDVLDVAGHITAGGAASIAAGRDVSLTTAQTGSTFAQVKGTTSMVDSAVSNQLSQMSTGGNLTVSAGRDLTLAGAQVAVGTSGAGDGLLLAGRTLAVTAVTNESDSDHHSDAASSTYSKAVHNDQTVVGGSVAASGALTLAAGLTQMASLNVTASALGAGGALALQATGDVNILSASESHLSDTAAKSSSSGVLKKSSTSMADYSASTLAIGSGVAGGSVSVAAGNDINIGASQITAQDALQLVAGRDLTVTTATASNSESHRLDQSKSSFVTKAAQSQAQTSDSTTAVGSVLSGGSVTVVSGRDTLVQGSAVVADNDITVIAGRNLSIVSAQDTASGSSASSSKKSGLIGSFYQPAIGTVKSSQNGTSSSVTQLGSQVASLGGDVTLAAGEKYTQTSSQVLAPGGDIRIAAKDVLINAAFDTSTSSEHSKYSQVALGGSVNAPVISAVQGLVSLAQSAKDAGGGRMQALAAVTAGLQVNAAAGTVAATLKDGVGIKVSVSLGSTKSESSSVQSANTAVGSSVSAGGSVSIVATGAGKDSNLTVLGSDISGGDDVSLRADNAVSLLAAENTAGLHSSNQASGSSIGIGFAFGGTQSGFTLEASANSGRGKADGDDVSYSNSHVSAGGTTTLTSGGDTTLQGAVVSGKTVVANVGGDLNIVSLQDSSTYASKQASSGFGLSLCLPPACYGASSVSASVSKAKAQGDFLSVVEQSGIQAGAGGFQVNVAGNTNLAGAVIASSQAAVDANVNRLSTATLTSSSLVNRDVYSASAYAVSASVSGKQGDQSGAAPGKQASAANAKTAAPTAAAGVGSESGSQSSTTQSGISGGVVTITNGTAQQALTGLGTDSALVSVARDVTTENSASKAGALTQAWNGEKLLRQVQAQAAITQAFSAQAPKMIADYAVSQTNDLRAQAKAESDPVKAQSLLDEAVKWDEGGVYRVALHAAGGALIGSVGGAVSAGAIASAATTLNELQASTQKVLEQQGMSPEAAKVVAEGIAQATALGLGTLVGGSGGGAAALVVDTNNRQLHPSETERLKSLQKAKNQAEQQRLADAACALVNCSAGVPDSDSNKLALMASEQRGQAYITEQSQLKVSGLFGYTTGEKFTDFLTLGQIPNRAVGAVQAVTGSAAGVFAITAGCSTIVACGLGTIVAVSSFDYSYAGYQQLFNGNAKQTFGEQVLVSFGASPTIASATYGALNFGAVAAVGALANQVGIKLTKFNLMSDASYETFSTNGIKATPAVMASAEAKALMQEIQAGSPYLKASEVSSIAQGYIESGVSLPQSGIATQGSILVKVVPKGDVVSNYSGYWMSVEQARAVAVMSVEQIGQKLGLPATQAANILKNGVDFYSISPRVGTLPTVFISRVADTSQGMINMPGGATQIIVPNRNVWTAPTSIKLSN